jgi:hypothetical protein
MKNKRKKLYCAFIDFAKVFDTVWGTGLWHKLLENDSFILIQWYNIS